MAKDPKSEAKRSLAWRQKNGDKVKAYGLFKIKARLELEESDPEAAKLKRQHRALLRKQQRARKKERERNQEEQASGEQGSEEQGSRERETRMQETREQESGEQEPGGQDEQVQEEQVQEEQVQEEPLATFNPSEASSETQPSSIASMLLGTTRQEQEPRTRRGLDRSIQQEVQEHEKVDLLGSWLEKLEDQARMLEQEVQEFVTRKKEPEVAGERCMRLLEELDGIRLKEGMDELKDRRRMLAKKINNILDINDTNIETMKKTLEYGKKKHRVSETSDEDDLVAGLGRGKEAKKLKMTRQSKEGARQRKINNARKDSELKELEVQLRESEIKLKQKEKTLEEAETKARESQAKILKLGREKRDLLEKVEKDEEWIGMVYRRMPKTGRQLFKDSVMEAREDLPKGTLLKARNLLGVNFHQALKVKEKQEPELARLVKDFAELNSDEMPYAKTCSSDPNKPNTRFALHYKCVLWEAFKADYPDHQCSYSTFCHYWPKHVQKPNLDSRGTVKCETCENAMMVQRGLKKANLIDPASDIFLSLKGAREGDEEELDTLLGCLVGLQEGERREEGVTFMRWVQVEVPQGEKRNPQQRGKPKTAPERRTQRVTIRRLAEIALADFGELRAHLQRNSDIKKYIGERRKEVEASEDQVMLPVDWSECGTFHQPGMGKYVFLLNIPYFCFLLNSYVFRRDTGWLFHQEILQHPQWLQVFQEPAIWICWAFHVHRS